MNQTANDEQSWVRPDEKDIVRRLKDYVSQVMTQGKWYVTDFLTPREQTLLVSIVRQSGAVLEFYGGYQDAERQRAMIMPDNWYPAHSDYQVSRFRLVASDAVTHGSVLGSILGLGIERRVLGDIVFTVDGVYVFASSSISRFVQESLVQVGKTPVRMEFDDSEQEIQIAARNMVEKTIFVSSLRADAVIAQSCNLSRSAAKEYIAKGLVSLNFSQLTKMDSELFPGDILSIRHFGRVKVKEIAGTTKKDRVRTVVEILKSS